MNPEELRACEGCEHEFAEDELDEEDLCEECHIQAGIDRKEAMNDLD